MSQTLVSTKYQVVIPKQIRRSLGIKPGQKFEVSQSGKQVILSPVKPKWIWPDEYIKNLKGIWKPDEIDTYLEEKRNLWDQ